MKTYLLTRPDHDDTTHYLFAWSGETIREAEKKGLKVVDLPNKIVYAISCSSAKHLGQKAVDAGASNYTGYDNDFVFFYEPENLSRPLKDETAKLFLEHSNLFITSVIKGNSVNEAKEKAEILIKSNIVKLLGRSDANTQLVRYLWWDLKHFVSHGNEHASL